MTALAVRDPDALIFAADMYGVQLDQLAPLTGGERAARAAAAPGRALGSPDTAPLRPRPAQPRPRLALGDEGGAGRLRPVLPPSAAGAVPASAHQGGDGIPYR